MALDLGGRLSTAQLDLIDDVLARRNGELRARLQLHTVSRSDAEQIVNALGDELTAHLDDHWEPTKMNTWSWQRASKSGSESAP